MTDALLDDALVALRWLMQRNVDFAGAAHIVAIVRALTAAATAAQCVRIEGFVDELVARWRYWAPDALIALRQAK